MEAKKVTEKSVLDANREFYNAIAPVYEKIDGRRNPKLESWLRSNLSNISNRYSSGKLLDLGTGSGLVTRCAHGLFKLRIAIDISSKILSINYNSFDFGLVADIGHLPFIKESFDVVTCFSVLHHLYSLEPLVSEVSRVLKPGGIFYSDHDMDKMFSERFHIPLSLYRKIYDSKSKYVSLNNKITPELYDLTEWKKKGIDSMRLINLFKNEGFSVDCHFHWFGLTPFTDILFAHRKISLGWAPLFSLLAVKP